MEFMVELQEAATLDDAFAAYEKLVQSLGFDGALYTFVPQIYLANKLPITPLFKTSDAYCPAFLRHYQEAGFDQHDFTVKRIAQGERQILDWWLESRKGVLTRQEKKVIITAREDYGIRNGLSLPLVGGLPGLGGVSCISGEKGDAYQLLLHEKLFVLQHCTRMFHEHVMAHSHLKIYFLAPLLEQLSPKEKRLLRFVLDGLPMKTLPDQVAGISQKYGEKLLDGIRIKFGGINKIRLILYIGMLHLHDYL